MSPPPDPIRKAFLALALEVASESCPSARAHPTDFALQLPVGVWHLQTSLDSLHHLPLPQQRRELQKMLVVLLTTRPLPHNPSTLRSMLVPRVSSLSLLLRNALLAGWQPGTQPAPFFQLDWFLGIDVVARDGAMLHEAAARLPEWGLSLRNVLPEARQQHPSRRRPEQAGSEAGIVATAVSSSAENLLMFDLDRGNNGVFLTIPQPAGSLVLLRSQSLVYRAPVHDHTAVDALLQLAEKSLDDNTTVCLLPYIAPETPVPGARLPLMPWLPSPDHPQWARLQRLRLLQHHRDWQQLRDALIASEHRQHGENARPVAPMLLMDHAPHPCGFTTYTTWSESGGILPNYAAHVLVVPDNSGRSYLIDAPLIYEVLQHVGRALPHHSGLAWQVQGGLPDSHRHVLTHAYRVIDL